MLASTTLLLYLSALLFSCGLTIVIIKRNAIFILMGIELMLNAANINLVAFAPLQTNSIEGQLFALFVVIIAVCEAALGIAIIIRVYRFYDTIVPNQIDQLKEKF